MMTDADTTNDMATSNAKETIAELAELADDIEDDTSASIPLQEFHLFPKLPKELRHSTFKHGALFPQLIRIDLGDESDVEDEDNPEDESNLDVRPSVGNNPKGNFLPRRLNSPLLAVSGESRFIASEQMAINENYAIVAYDTSFIGSQIEISKSISFRQELDTLIFSDIHHFYEFLTRGCLKHKSDTSLLPDMVRKYSGYASMRSIAIGGFFERIKVNWELLCVSMFPEEFGLALTGFLAWFQNLEELIIIAPTLQQLRDRAPDLQERSSGQFGWIGREATGDQCEVIQRVKDQLKSELGKSGKHLLAAHQRTGPVDRTEYKGRPTTVSDWWKDPVVTWLTEDELKLRFGLDLAIELKTGPQFPDV